MNIVIYVCHVDDDILGSGGLIPQMIEAGHNVGVVYATDASTPRAYDSEKQSMAHNAMDVLGVPSENVHFLEFPELRFDELAVIDFNRAFVDLELESDLLITTDRTDVNQDHHVVFQSALVIARSIERQIGLLTAEIVSSSEWSDQTFTPHLYVDVEQTIDTKDRRDARNT